jgi:hypothetical protein
MQGPMLWETRWVGFAAFAPKTGTPRCPALYSSSIFDPHQGTMPITLKEFESAFPQLVDDPISHAKSYGVPENGLNWWRQVTIPIY